MKYKVIIQGQYYVFQSKYDLVLGVIDLIKIKPIQRETSKQIKNIVMNARNNDVNFIARGPRYTTKFIVEVAGGELI